MMTTTVEDLTQQIGQMITQAIPAPWQEAQVKVSFAEGVVTAQGWYTAQDAGTRHSFALPGSINRLFAQLRTLSQKTGQSMWHTATFTIKADTHFTLEFTYPG
jgi:hypothetical protein